MNAQEFRSAFKVGDMIKTKNMDFISFKAHVEIEHIPKTSDSFMGRQRNYKSLIPFTVFSMNADWYLCDKNGIKIKDVAA
jgi:hypothetical protein